MPRKVGRPTLNPSDRLIEVQVRVPLPLRRRILRMAKGHYTTPSQLLRGILTEYFQILDRRERRAERAAQPKNESEAA